MVVFYLGILQEITGGVGMALKSTMLERGIFTVSRVVIALVALCALGGIIYSVVLFAGAAGEKGEVRFVDVKKHISSADTVNSDLSESAETISKLPPRTREYLGSKENLKVLNGWLAALKNDDERADFIANMESVIVEAERREESVIDIINAYPTVKLDRMKSTPLGDYEAPARLAIAFLALAVSISLLIGAGLLLVMLAVERNTRPAHLQNG